MIKKEFACDEDAIKYAEECVKKYPLLSLIELEITHENRRITREKWRQNKDEEMNVVSFIKGKLIENTEAVSLELKLLGRFILSSNATQLNGKEVLNIYKNQMHVERGFRFFRKKVFLRVKKHRKTIPNSLKKPTDHPTLQWALSFFTYVVEASLFVDGIYKGTNLTQPYDVKIVLTILAVLGLPYEKFYSWG